METALSVPFTLSIVLGFFSVYSKSGSAVLKCIDSFVFRAIKAMDDRKITAQSLKGDVICIISSSYIRNTLSFLLHKVLKAIKVAVRDHCGISALRTKCPLKSIEDPSCMWAWYTLNLIQKVKCPHAGIVRKFAKRVTAQAPSSSPNNDSNSLGPS
ncbi:hypothetical protein AVEN_194264-1 [Araneus ventricosus]|uniref:Uncharacterized protein n=1 Tax=Araneus ventricosus TaxID=182803 RepID=A0A4Y2GED6_ARAVE|nr:hypothetical protein AVEN_194264-1 [Araneus ventricosus]